MLQALHVNAGRFGIIGPFTRNKRIDILYSSSSEKVHIFRNKKFSKPKPQCGGKGNGLLFLEAKSQNVPLTLIAESASLGGSAQSLSSFQPENSLDPES